jgi:probable rRNA maturation factor
MARQAKLRNWIYTVIEKEKRLAGIISYIFTDDESLLKINEQYLNHHTYTDIITFDYSEAKTLSGDIFISIDRVKDNAAKYNVTFEEELLRVMVHGILHLCGYNDKTKVDSNKMRAKENTAISLYRKLK